jgi:F0F1-type ATP synthase membrane subunit b/b'
MKSLFSWKEIKKELDRFHDEIADNIESYEKANYKDVKDKK